MYSSEFIEKRIFESILNRLSNEHDNFIEVLRYDGWSPDEINQIEKGWFACHDLIKHYFDDISSDL